MIDIYEKINAYRKQGKDLVLVTVTEKDGMGPADIGKKMLVTQDNEAFGTVGGGAIEFFAREKCKEIILSNKYNNISPFTLEVAVVSTVDNISIKDKSFTSATKYGLIDINGKELLPCIYDSIHPHWDGFTEIIKDGVKKATSIVRIIDGRFIWDKAVKWPR